MTFWQYIRDLRGYEDCRPDLNIIAELNYVEDRGYTLPDYEPQSFEEVEFTLSKLGVNEQKIEEVKQLWNGYQLEKYGRK